MLNADSEQARSRDLWLSLPLALQYHIYKHLSLSNSDQMISKSLGLSEKHFKELQTIVTLRDESPASVADIWDSCANSNHLCEDSMVTDQIHIDSDVFHHNLSAMVFASHYELAYEPEILRAKKFLESRRVPTTLLGVWIPDCTDSRRTEFFRYLPRELVKLASIDITTSSIVVGEANDRRKPAVSGSQDRNNNFHPRGILKNPLARSPNVQEASLVVTDLTLKRGRHPLATVTSVEDTHTKHHRGPEDPKRGRSDLKPELLGGVSQDETQHDNDERKSGVMRLRDRNSIARTREATPYYLDSGLQQLDFSVDESEGAAEISEPDSGIQLHSSSAGYLTLKFKKKDELARIFHGQPHILISRNTRTPTPLPGMLGDGREHSTLVTLKVSPEKFRLVHAKNASGSPIKPLSSPSTDRLGGPDQYSNQRSHILKSGPSSDAQSPTRKRKADFADTPNLLVKRVRLGSNQSLLPSINEDCDRGASIQESPRAESQITNMFGQFLAPPAAQAGMLARSIETDDMFSPTNIDDPAQVGCLNDFISARGEPFDPQPRDCDRAPSFSPIPENTHLEEFQALLRSLAPVPSTGFDSQMQEITPALSVCAFEGPEHLPTGPVYGNGRTKRLPLRFYSVHNQDTNGDGRQAM